MKDCMKLTVSKIKKSQEYKNLKFRGKSKLKKKDLCTALEQKKVSPKKVSPKKVSPKKVSPKKFDCMKHKMTQIKKSQEYKNLKLRGKSKLKKKDLCNALEQKKVSPKKVKKVSPKKVKKVSPKKVSPKKVSSVLKIKTSDSKISSWMKTLKQQGCVAVDVSDSNSKNWTIHPKKLVTAGNVATMYKACQNGNCNALLKYQRGKSKRKQNTLLKEINIQMMASKIGISPKIYEAYKCDTGVGFIMETLPGDTYKQFLWSGALSNNYKINEYMDKLLKVVEKMHDKRIFHNDLHMNNVMINNDDIKIIDFGRSYHLKDNVPKEFDKYFKRFDIKQVYSEHYQLFNPYGDDREKFKLYYQKKYPFLKLSTQDILKWRTKEKELIKKYKL